MGNSREFAPLFDSFTIGPTLSFCTDMRLLSSERKEEYRKTNAYITHSKFHDTSSLSLYGAAIVPTI